MTSFLLLLSFLIHLILFISLYHLYERIKRDKDEQAEQIKEMLANFMNDIRHENNKLEQKIHESKLKQHINNEYTPPTPKDLKDEQQSKGEIESTTPYAKPKRQQKQVEDVIETTLEGQVLQLAHEGKSIDEIAKQLNRGKTEVELLIKLNG